MSECDGQPKSEPKDMSENEKPAAWVRAAAEEADAATRAFERAYARFLDPAEYAEPPMPKPERPDYVAVIAAHAPKVSQSAIEVADDAMYQGLLDGDPADSFAQAVKVNERRDRLAMIIQEARDVPAGPTHPSLWKPSQPAEEAADKYFDVVDYPSVNAQYEALAAIIQSAIDAATGPLRERLRDLLAVLHRDGGHYTGKHGLEKSAEDASAIASRLVVGEDDLKAKLIEAEKPIMDDRYGEGALERHLEAWKDIANEAVKDRDKLHSKLAEAEKAVDLVQATCDNWEAACANERAEAERLTAAAESVAKQLACVCEPCYTDRQRHASDCKAYLADELKQALAPEDAE